MTERDARDDPPDKDDNATERAADSPERIAGVDPKRGRRSRKKLQGWLEREEDLLTGSTELMRATDPSSFEHRTVFRGERLTGRGGPATEVLELVRERASDHANGRAWACPRGRWQLA